MRETRHKWPVSVQHQSHYVITSGDVRPGGDPWSPASHVQAESSELRQRPGPPLQLSLNFTTINPERPGRQDRQWEWQLELDYYATDKFRSDYFLRMGLTLSASTRDKIKPGSRELDSHSRFLVTNTTLLLS